MHSMKKDLVFHPLDAYLLQTFKKRKILGDCSTDKERKQGPKNLKAK